MRKATHIEITNRLETTKRFGLLDDYRIEWPPQPLARPHVTVKGRPAVPAQITKNYVAALLAPFLATRHIHVT